MSESNWDSQGMVTCTDGESSDRMDHKASLFQNLKLKKSRLKRLMANSDSAMESDYVVSSIGSSEIDMGSQYSSSDEADSGYGSTRHRRRKVLKFHPKTDNKTTSTHVKEARKEHSSKSKQAPSFGFAYYGIPPGMIHGQTAPNPKSDTESSGQRRPSIGFIPVLTSMIPQYSGSAGNTTDTESPSSGDTSSLDNDIKPVILTQFPPAFIMTAKGPMPVINACGPGGISQFPILKMNSSEPKKAEQFVQMLTPSQLAGMQASQSKRESESQRNSAYNQKEQTKTGAQDYSFIEHYTNGNFEYKGILKKGESLTSENAPVPMATVAQACPYDDQEEQLVCAICNDRATGLHYGIITCEGCKGFFKRTVQNKRVYNCVGNGNCVINKLQRNRCQFCRFKKCLQMGMVLAAVREDRMPGGRNSGAVYNLYKVKYKKHKKKDQMVKLFKEQVAQIKVDGNDGKIETEMITERKRIPLPYVSFNKGEMPQFVQEDHRSQMRHNSAFSRSTKRSTPPQPSWDSCSLSSMCSSDASVAWNFSDKSYDNGPCFVPTNESQNDKSRVTYEERLANDATRKHENQFHNTGQHGGSSFVSQGPVNPNCKNNHLANLLQSKQDTIPRTEHQVRPCNPEFASQVFSSREDVQYSRDTTPAATFDKPDGLQKCVNSNNTPTRTLSTLMNYNVSRSVKSGTACEYLSTVGDHNAQARLGREQCGDTNEFVSGNYKCGVNQSRHCQQEFSPRMKNRDVSEQGLYKPPAQNATDCRMLEYTTTAAHCPQTVTTNDTSPHKCYSYNNQFSERTIEKQTQNFIGEYRKKEQCYRPKECFSQAMARDYSNERHYPHESDTKVFVQHQPRKERVSHPYKDSRCSPVTHRTNSLHESQRDFTQTYLQYQHSVSLSRENSDQHSSDHKTLDFGRHSGTVSDTNPCNTTGNDVKSVHNDTSQTNTEAPSVWHQQHTEHLRPDPVRKTDSKTHLDYQEAHEFNKTRSSDHSGIIQTHGLCDQNGFHVDMHCYNVSEIDTSRSNNDNSTRDPYQVREPETEDHVTDESHVTDENHVTDDCYQFSERPSLEDTVHNSDPLRCNQKSDKSKTGCHEQDGQYSNPSPELCSPKSHSQLIQELVNCNTLLDISDSFNFDENDWIDSDITDNFYRLADQIVDKLVAWTRHLPFYSEIPLNVHSNILTSRWHELLVLMTAARRTLTLQEDPRSTHITYNILLNSNMQKLDSFLSRISRMDKDTATMDIQKVRDIMERLSMIMFRFLQMRVGIQEFVSLQVILLLNHNDPSQHAKIETMQQKYTNALEWYVTKTFPKDPTRLGELLIRIPEIQTTSSLLLKNKMIYIPFFLNS